MSTHYKSILRDICIDTSDKKNLTDIEVDEELNNLNYLGDAKPTYSLFLPFYYTNNKRILSNFFKLQLRHFRHLIYNSLVVDLPIMMIREDTEFISDSVNCISKTLYQPTLRRLTKKTDNARINASYRYPKEMM